MELWEDQANYVERMVKRLSRKEGVEVSVTFGNSRASTAKQHGDGRYEIRFGYECLDIIYSHGWSEYKTISHVWGEHNGSGNFNGLKCLVLHEFAHILQFEKNGRWHGSQHNDVFITCLQELIGKYL